MPNTHVSIVQGRSICVVHGDFTQRSKVVHHLTPRPESDEMVITRAAALESRGKRAEAEVYLEQHLRQKN